MIVIVYYGIYYMKNIKQICLIFSMFICTSNEYTLDINNSYPKCMLYMIISDNCVKFM